MIDDQELNQILTYTQHGFAVHPIQWMAKIQFSCGRSYHSPGKHPHSPHGYEDITTDQNQVISWHTTFPKANWAIATGKPSLIVVVDVDYKNNGLDSWERITQEHLDFETLPVISGGGGRHSWFSQGPGWTVLG